MKPLSLVDKSALWRIAETALQAAFWLVVVFACLHRVDELLRIIEQANK